MLRHLLMIAAEQVASIWQYLVEPVQQRLVRCWQIKQNIAGSGQTLKNMQRDNIFSVAEERNHAGAGDSQRCTAAGIENAANLCQNGIHAVTSDSII